MGCLVAEGPPPQGQLELAASSYGLAVALRPNDEETWNNGGLSYSVEGEERHAVFVAWPKGGGSQVLGELGHMIVRRERDKWPLPRAFFELSGEEGLRPEVLEVNLANQEVRLVSRDEAIEELERAEPMRALRYSRVRSLHEPQENRVARR